MSDSSRNEKYDLLLAADRIVCPAKQLDGPRTVAVNDGRIAAIGSDVIGSAKTAMPRHDGIVLPGLIDLHAHPACAGSVFGVDPDSYMLRTGATTVCSQGDAGADNVAQYVEQTIRTSRTRVRLAINLSRVGESSEDGCFARLGDADVDACVAAAEAHRAFIWAIAVNISQHACGDTEPREVMRLGLEAASRAELPLLFGMRRPEDWPLAEQLALLRAGDVVTYCFRHEPHCIVSNGRVLPEVRAARERGVLFDVGHGCASFNFDVAEAAIADGFCPDTISTDLQARHIGSKIEHHLPLVMSKLHAAGMSEADVFAAATATPAKILGLDSEIGALKPGACADLTLISSRQRTMLADCYGNERQGILWQACSTVRAGVIVDGLESRNVI